MYHCLVSHTHKALHGTYMQCFATELRGSLPENPLFGIIRCGVNITIALHCVALDCIVSHRIAIIAWQCDASHPFALQSGPRRLPLPSPIEQMPPASAAALLVCNAHAVHCPHCQHRLYSQQGLACRCCTIQPVVAADNMALPGRATCHRVHGAGQSHLHCKHVIIAAAITAAATAGACRLTTRWQSAPLWLASVASRTSRETWWGASTGE